MPDYPGRSQGARHVRQPADRQERTRASALPECRDILDQIAVISDFCGQRENGFRQVRKLDAVGAQFVVDRRLLIL